MNKQTEALRMAKQHIIERKGGRGGAVCYVKSDEDVIKAIDEALEQPAQEYLTRAQQVIRANNSAQEPVAWVGSLNEFDMRRLLNEGYELSTALYTHPAPSEPFIGGSVCPSCGNHSLFKTDKSEWCVTHKCLWQSDYPPSWQGLSDDEIHNYADHNFAFASEHFDEIFKFARSIEQALKEKNAKV